MVKNLGLIGVGRLGLPVAEVFAEHFSVAGFDIKEISSNNFSVMKSISDVCQKSDIIFIAVPTPHETIYGGELPSTSLPPKNFDYTIVENIVKEVYKYTTRQQSVVLISTVLPGTCRNKLTLKDRELIYNPYLIAMGSVKQDMKNPEMIIIGTENGIISKGVEELLKLYATITQNNPRQIVGTWEEAECVKIFYNTFISAKISLVNMIQDVAERLGNVNVDVVTDALKNSTLRITGPAYMTAGMGDGGACHPRDNIALRWLSHELNLGYDLFEAVMKSREIQAYNLANKLIHLATEYDHKKIWIYGKSYKPFVEYTDGSYSLLVAHYLKDSQFKIGFIDPLTGDVQNEVHGVVLLAHPIQLGCQEMQHLPYCSFKEGTVILDPWRMVKKSELPSCIVYHYGNTRRTTSLFNTAVTNLW